MYLKQKVKYISDYLRLNPLLIVIICWYTFSWSWVLATNTLELVKGPLLGKVLAFILLVISVTLSSVLMWWCILQLKKLMRSNFKLFALTAFPLLALADFIVAWFHALLWFGPNSLLDSMLPLGSPALLVINTPLGFASRLVGFFGLSSFVWLVIILISTPRKRKFAIIPAIVFILLSIVGWYTYKDPQGQVINATLINENLDNKLGAINTNDQDIILFPEYGLQDVRTDSSQNRLTSSGADNRPTYFIGSARIPVENAPGYHNTLFFGNADQSKLESQNKYRLIPGGEDLPYLVRAFLKTTRQDSFMNYYNTNKNVIRSDSQLTPLKVRNGLVIGAAICSSIIHPPDYQHLTKEGATILTNSASLSTFKNSPVFTWQHKSFAKFMATANSRYFLQSANSLEAYMYDNNGQLQAQTDEFESLAVTAKTNHTKTVYSVFGEWLVLTGILCAAFFVIKRPTSRFKNSR